MQSLRESGDYWNYIRYLEIRHEQAKKRRARRHIRRWAWTIGEILLILLIYKLVMWGVQWIKS